MGITVEAVRQYVCDHIEIFDNQYDLDLLNDLWLALAKETGEFDTENLPNDLFLGRRSLEAFTVLKTSVGE